MKNEKGLESANVAFFLCVATKYSVAKNVGRECQESSVPFPDLAEALGLCLSFSMQKLFSIPQRTGCEQGSKPWRLHRSSQCPLYKTCRFSCLFSLFYPKLMCLCFHTPRCSIHPCAEHTGITEGLVWGLTLPGGACGWCWGMIGAASSAKPAPSSDCCSVRSFSLWLTQCLLWSCSQAGFSLLALFSCSITASSGGCSPAGTC